MPFSVKSDKVYKKLIPLSRKLTPVTSGSIKERDAIEIKQDIIGCWDSPNAIMSAIKQKYADSSHDLSIQRFSCDLNHKGQLPNVKKAKSVFKGITNST